MEPQLHCKNKAKVLYAHLLLLEPVESPVFILQAVES